MITKKDTIRSHYRPLKEGKAQSETSFYINFVSMLIGVLALVVCRHFGYKDYTNLFILFAGIITVSIVSLEYIFFPRTAPLRQWKILRKVNWKRVFYKEVALLASFGVIAFFYFVLPMFSYNDFTLQYFPFLKKIVPWIMLGSVFYFALMDKIDPEVKDDYYKVGYAITHLKKTMTKFEFGNYVRSWIVKAFWLSLMQPAMIVKIRWLITYNWEMMKDGPVEWFWTANVIVFFMDLTFASSGYMMGLKLFNTQTRTAEPTLFGWTVAIMCYWPFWQNLFYPFFLKHEGPGWLKTFETGSVMFWCCFAIIIIMELLYALATISAGIHFSNVTYRGLWRTGLYRYTKHPAYVFKNISWWFLFLPFMWTDASKAFRCSVLLFGLNIVYYLRARTEERHLSHYPEYEAYALEMNEKSIFRWCAKILPFLKYKPLPKDKRLF